MRKKRLAILFSLVFAYLFAFGLCVRALGGEVAVGAELPVMKIVVDAGHGGIDGGVVGVKTGVKESDLNLSIAFKLKEKLTDAGFEVVMTRKSEAGLYDTTAKGFKKRDMQKRKSVVEESSPSLVISVHQNFYPSSSTRGGQVFYFPGYEEGKLFAESVQGRLNLLYETQGVKPRKTMSADYFMLRFPLPSVIVECGFLSSPRDEALLSDEEFQARLASAIVAGTTGYLALKESGA